ncbi:Ubiquitin-conjugating enzyme E2 J1 [Rhizophlyctis rosea]|uniref:Ubiquitin-conjugating enzyme E2 J1 n=1 Tax=Rhizophlyctis rosea TaxID=64517 RepID=A0AAD5SAG1_9FUNG|nr:Ubiquitin-conjugating enzyme E2 J1 [Rhizophlyctis rosea]
MAATSRSPAMKRLMKELAELQSDPSPEFTAAPLEDNLFEWHFTIRGPAEGGFQGGRYHGRIVFPADYPFKPPDFYFLTQNGRFELNKKICLSITGYHTETWRPAWGIRTALTAIISFFPTKGEGAIGSLDWTEEERKVCALKSRTWTCPSCGSRNEDALPDESVVASVKLEAEEGLGILVKAEGKAEDGKGREANDGKVDGGVAPATGDGDAPTTSPTSSSVPASQAPAEQPQSTPVPLPPPSTSSAASPVIAPPSSQPDLRQRATPSTSTAPIAPPQAAPALSAPQIARLREIQRQKRQIDIILLAIFLIIGYLLFWRIL